MRGIARVVIAGQLAGCSIAMVKGPPSNPPANQPIACDDRMTIPKTDMAIGVGILIGALVYVAAVALPAGGELSTAERVPLIAGGAAAPVFAVSYLVGKRRIERCRELRGSYLGGMRSAPSSRIVSPLR